jgi:hypothetical protein
MKTPHGGYLGVTHPDGTIFFIVYPRLGEPSRKFSLMPSDAFKETSTLRLTTAVKGNPRVHPRDTLYEPIFTQSGVYTLTVADNLEGDFGADPATCPVTLID